MIVNLIDFPRIEIEIKLMSIYTIELTIDDPCDHNKLEQHGV